MFLRTTLLILFSLIPAFVWGQTQEYFWPTDASKHLTSTFGETRSAHFHSGLDIKTWGREGYKVFASKDGLVYRLGVSVEGYGKVIYLKHDDGSFTVYAHLQRMNNELQAYVDSVRMIDYSFETQLYVEDQNMRVSRGDIIGYTGSTGVGPPHLHFEIRDSSDNPINPLLTNLKVEDDIAPTFSALIALPLTKNTTIRGSKYPQLYYPSTNDSGKVDFGTIDVNGTTGISIATFDEANGVTNKYAVYELGLISGEDTLFYERLDEFKFEEDDVMFIDRLPAFGATRRSYQTLFKKDGPENPFYKLVDPRTYINVGDSIASYTIFAKDYYGNESRTSFTIDGGIIQKDQQKKEIKNHMYEWFWTEDWTFDGANIIDLKNFTFGSIWNPEKNQYLFGKTEDRMLLSRVIPNDPYSFSTPDQKLTVKFARHTFFDTLSVISNTGYLDGYPYLSLHPATIASRIEFKIEYYLGEDFNKENRYLLFRVDRSRDRIIYVDSELKGRTLHAFPSELGEFIIIADNSPPIIQTPKIVQTSFGKWFVHIPAEDSLSGINFKDSNIYVNGIRGILEYDIEEDLLIYYHPDFIPRKENIIRLTVLDKAGNKSIQTFKLNQI